MDGDALVVGLSSLFAGGVYLYLGGRLASRHVSDEMWVPATQFALFWIALALSTDLSGLLSLVAAFYPPPLDVVVTFLYYNLLLISVALWGLTCYLFFLYRGRSVLIPVSVLYIVEYALLVYYVTAGRPDAVTVAAGSVNPHDAVAVSGALAIAAILLLILPELIAVVAYFTLYFRSDDPTVRYRVGLVSGGLMAWFLLSLLGSLFGAGLVELTISRLLIIAAALVVLLAYFPPKRLRSRLGVAGI